MSVSAKAFSKWDLERFIYSCPDLYRADRDVAIQLLKTLDNKFRPIRNNLHSQGLLGWRIRAARETVNRAVRKLRILGYFHTTWITVNRPTKQGIKGVTRVIVTLGPVLQALVDQARRGNSADQARGVTSHHPSPTPPGGPGTGGDPVIAKSADRNGSAAPITAEFKRKALAAWPRLAGAKPIDPERLPSSTPWAVVQDQLRQAAETTPPDMTEAEYYERIWANRQQHAAELADRIAAAELGGRKQPRRRPPRSHR